MPTTTSTCRNSWSCRSACPASREALRAGAEIFHALKGVLKGRGLHTTVGDEGGFAPDLKSNEEAIETILEAIGKAGYKAGEDVWLGLDAAASEFYKDGKYDLAGEGKVYDSAGFIDVLAGWCDKYPIITIEDGMAEQDDDGWKTADRAPGQAASSWSATTTSSPTRAIFRKGIDDGIANAILIKVNQIGTLSETLETIAMADAAKYAAVISHRSGETEDTTIADIAVATTRHADQDRLAVAQRSHRQVQPAAAHRGAAG